MHSNFIFLSVFLTFSIVSSCKKSQDQSANIKSETTAGGFDLLDDETDLEEFKYVITQASKVADIPELRVPQGSQAVGTNLELGTATNLLPELLRKNVSLKHGLKFAGLRGHPVDKIVSQSADILYPRVVLWDEENGFSLSWNGGVNVQTAGSRIDVLGYNHSTETYFLHALRFPIPKPSEGSAFPYEEVRSDHPSLEERMRCVKCHGPNSRPIWNMYPDWGAFYGSDNDEISFANIDKALAKAEANLNRNNSHKNRIKVEQLRKKAPYLKREGEFYYRWRDGIKVYETKLAGDAIKSRADFEKLKSDTLAQIAQLTANDAILKKIQALKEVSFETHIEAMKRYQPLTAVLEGKYYREFSESFLPSHKDDAFKHFPLRPSNELDGEHQSRSFFFRPNLRLGILYNRINSKFVYSNFLKPKFNQDPLLRDAFLHSALDCSWDSIRSTNGKWRGDITTYKNLIAKYGFSRFKSPTGRNRIHFLELLRKFSHKSTRKTLSINDYDLRATYGNSMYRKMSSDSFLSQTTNSVMGLGYYVSGSDPLASSYSSSQKMNNLIYPKGEYYFNSYWDGSATINEYIAAMIVNDNAEYANFKSSIRNFQLKYARYFDRFNLDKKYFNAMDRILSKGSKQVLGWIPAPYPNDIGAEHHREGYTSSEYDIWDFYRSAPDMNQVVRSSRKMRVKRNSPENYQQLCTTIRRKIRSKLAN